MDFKLILSFLCGRDSCHILFQIETKLSIFKFHMLVFRKMLDKSSFPLEDSRTEILTSVLDEIFAASVKVDVEAAKFDCHPSTLETHDWNDEVEHVDVLEIFRS